MAAITSALTAGAAAVPHTPIYRPLAIDLPTLIGFGGPVRAVVAFLVVGTLGSILLLWNRPLVERAVLSSTTRPLYSLAHGVAAHIVIAFGTVYAANQLGPLEFAGESAATVGLLAGAVLLVGVGTVGLTVVGTILAEYATSRDAWSGLLVGATLAAIAGLLPPVYGVSLWLLLVSMGIGGPVRRWFHASSDVDL